MSDGDRISAAEEHIMRLQNDQDELDRVVRMQADTIDELRRRLGELESRLERIEPGEP